MPSSLQQSILFFLVVLITLCLAPVTSFGGIEPMVLPLAKSLAPLANLPPHGLQVPISTPLLDSTSNSHWISSTSWTNVGGEVADTLRTGISTLTWTLGTGILAVTVLSVAAFVRVYENIKGGLEKDLRGTPLYEKYASQLEPGQTSLEKDRPDLLEELGLEYFLKFSNGEVELIPSLEALLGIKNTSVPGKPSTTVSNSAQLVNAEQVAQEVVQDLEWQELDLNQDQKEKLQDILETKLKQTLQKKLDQ